MTNDGRIDDELRRQYESEEETERGLRLLNCGGPSPSEIFLAATGRVELTGEQQAHVASCPICQRWFEVTELGAEHRAVRSIDGADSVGAASRLRRHYQRLIPWGIGGLAAAACLVIAILFQSRTADPDLTQVLTPYFAAMQGDFSGAYRGGGEQEPTRQGPQSPYMADFLEEVRPILERMHARSNTLRRWRNEGYAWVEINSEGRFVATAKARADGAGELVQGELAAETADRELLVEAIMRAHNTAATGTGAKALTQRDGPAIRQALDRQRATELR